MKILLDENVVPTAKTVLESMNYETALSRDVIGVGVTDDKIFEYASKNKYILITHNGKHFLIFIPPVKDTVSHSGFIWLRCIVTNKNCELIFKEIGTLLSKQDNIDDKYYSVKYNRKDNLVSIDLKYPKERNT